MPNNKTWSDSELTTNTHPQLKVLMENLAMEVAEISAQVSRLREETPRGDGDKRSDVQGRSIEPDTSNSDSDGLLCEGWSGRLSYTTESAFPSKVLQQKSGGRHQYPQLFTSDSDGSSARLESETTADESETVRIFNEFTEKVVEVSRTAILPNTGAAGENVTLEDYENALHQVDGKALLSCAGDETMPNKMNVLFATLAVSVYSSLREVGATTIEL